jgi:thiol:disulfide interchange protein DsbD
MKKVFLILCTALMPGIAVGQFFGTPIRSSVSAPEKTVPAGSTFDVVVDFELDPDVHLYKDKISFEWRELINAEYVRSVLPQGRPTHDTFGSDENAIVEVYQGSVRVVAKLKSTGKEGDPISISGKLGYQGCTDQICYPPGTLPFKFDLTTAAALIAEEPQVSAEEPQPTPKSAVSKREPEKAPTERKSNAIWLILMAFGAGVAVSLTPCVYPMIPVTAAIIGGTKQKGKLGALFSSAVYVLGLSITYSVIGLLVASGGAKVRAWLASPWVLVPIAALFVVLALSMFEVFSIQIQPKSLSRLQTSLSQKKHTLAIFVLGIVSGFVAGPCVTAPLAWVLVIVAQQGSKLVGFFMLFALAWGMGTILIVAGTLTSALPQAGEWTIWVKKLFGFVMLWAAGYFLSSVIGETAYHAATAVILIAAAVFLGGFDTLTKESGFADRAKRFVGLLAILAAAYLLTGELMKGRQPAPAQVFRKAGYEDVEKATSSGQPVILDFYAEWCDICKGLDNKTFGDPRVVEALSRFHPLKVDVEEQPRLAKEFNVLGPPTVVFIGSDGKEIGELRFSGFKNADEFLRILKKVK